MNLERKLKQQKCFEFTKINNQLWEIVSSVPDLATVSVLCATLPITVASCRALLQVKDQDLSISQTLSGG